VEVQQLQKESEKDADRKNRCFTDLLHGVIVGGQGRALALHGTSDLNHVGQRETITQFLVDRGFR